jgi:hypothetical protein
VAFQLGAFQTPGFQQGGQQAAVVAPTPAGSAGKRRKRWQAEYDGVVREFDSPQEAREWIMAQARVQVKRAEPRKAPKIKQIIRIARQNAPKIFYDGKEVTHFELGERTAVDILLTGVEVRLLQAMARRMEDDEEDELILLLYG